ncbi:MAG: hypothetical protein K6G11_02230, partial [Lachnospiraceae bacterium]|nr:hypothetical protein [Lachnospiraceae bacterium]
MKKIFWGFILHTFYLLIPIGGVEVRILPAFIGYMLVFYGLNELYKKENEEHFKSARTLSVVLTAYEFIIFVLNIFKINTGVTEFLATKDGIFQAREYDAPVIIMNIISLIFVAINVYMYYHILKGVQQMEQNHTQYYNSLGLESVFKAEVILSSIFVICMLITIIFHKTFINIFFDDFIQLANTPKAELTDKLRDQLIIGSLPIVIFGLAFVIAYISFNIYKARNY